MMKIRIIGDIHQEFKHYFRHIGPCDRSIQIGDLALNYKMLKDVDPDKHVFFGGNHDNYDVIKQIPNNIGDFGPSPFSSKVFFIRGAWSIDQKCRKEGISWWREEELSDLEIANAYDMYKLFKPEIMLSHECPFSLLKHLKLDPNFARNYGYYAPDSCIKTRTNLLLDGCFQTHKPKLWLFGHYHRDFDMTIDGTRFRCLTGDGCNNAKNHYMDIEI